MQQQLHSLDIFLHQHGDLWRPQPYKQTRPPWCDVFPELRQALLALSDADVARLESDNQALIKMLSGFVSSLAALQELSTLPLITEIKESLSEARFGWEMPGRKRAQVDAFTQAIGSMTMPILEWCGGKGHLGRTLALLWNQPVETVEWNEDLCAEGRRLAARAKVKQIFHTVDALDEKTKNLLHHKHVVALHACGELHRRLLRGSITAAAKAIDVSPCCYHLGSGGDYIAFNPDLQLSLSRDDLRLAVTNTGTASKTELKLRDKEMAWKLGFEILRQSNSNSHGYSNLKPIDKKFLSFQFAEFCLQLAARESVKITIEPDWKNLEEQGWQRQREVMRLSLVRFAFRRALETWLVLDMACYLQQQGYTVVIRQFCRPEITPRNILLSARCPN